MKTPDLAGVFNYTTAVGYYRLFLKFNKGLIVTRRKLVARFNAGNHGRIGFKCRRGIQSGFPNLVRYCILQSLPIGNLDKCFACLHGLNRYYEFHQSRSSRFYSIKPASCLDNGRVSNFNVERCYSFNPQIDCVTHGVGNASKTVARIPENIIIAYYPGKCG